LAVTIVRKHSLKRTSLSPETNGACVSKSISRVECIPLDGIAPIILDLVRISRRANLHTPIIACIPLRKLLQLNWINWEFLAGKATDFPTDFGDFSFYSNPG
jgi:hypothetical protein